MTSRRTCTSACSQAGTHFDRDVSDAQQLTRLHDDGRGTDAKVGGARKDRDLGADEFRLGGVVHCVAPVQRNVDRSQHRKPDCLEDRVVDLFCHSDAISALPLHRAPIISCAAQSPSACPMLNLRASVLWSGPASYVRVNACNHQGLGPGTPPLDAPVCRHDMTQSGEDRGCWSGCQAWHHGAQVSMRFARGAVSVPADKQLEAKVAVTLGSRESGVRQATGDNRRQPHTWSVHANIIRSKRYYLIRPAHVHPSALAAGLPSQGALCHPAARIDDSSAATETSTEAQSAMGLTGGGGGGGAAPMDSHAHAAGPKAHVEIANDDHRREARLLALWRLLCRHLDVHHNHVPFARLRERGKLLHARLHHSRRDLRQPLHLHVVTRSGLGKP